MDRPPMEVPTGAAYEAERDALRGRLAADAELRRVQLGDLALVFENRDTVRAALAELLRAEGITEPDSVRSEAAHFLDIEADRPPLVATLFIDRADPVLLAERLTELAGIAEAVSLEVDGRRSPAVAAPAGMEGGAARLRFELDEAQRRSFAGGAACTVVVEHPACRVAVALTPDQVRAIGADLGR